MGAAEWGTVVVTLVLGVAGYPASPYAELLDEAGRRQLHASFTNWYYQNGDGMMLEQLSRSVYIEARII